MYKILIFALILLFPAIADAATWEDVKPQIDQRIYQLRSQGFEVKVRMTYNAGLFTADIYKGTFTDYSHVAMNTRRMTKMYYKPDMSGSWTPADATYIDKTVYSDGTCTTDAQHNGDYSGKPAEYSVQGWWLTTLWTAPGGYYPQSSVNYASSHSLLPDLTGYDASYDFCLYKKYLNEDEYLRGKYGETIDSSYQFTLSPDCDGANPTYTAKPKAGDNSGIMTVAGGGAATSVSMECQYGDCIDSMPGWKRDCNPPPPIYCASYPCIYEFEQNGHIVRIIEKWENCCYIMEKYVDGALESSYDAAYGTYDDMDDAYEFEFDSDISGGGASEITLPEDALGKESGYEDGFENITSGRAPGGGGFGQYSSPLGNYTSASTSPEDLYEAKGEGYRKQVISSIHTKLRTSFPVSVIYGVSDYASLLLNSFSEEVPPSSSYTLTVGPVSTNIDILSMFVNLLEPARGFIRGLFYFMFTGLFLVAVVDLIKHR